MATKVVINICHGGFGISLEATKRMASNGCEDAQYMLNKHKNSNNDDANFYEQYYGPRHNPHLVEAVTALGPKSWYDCSELDIWEVKGDRYIIQSYDGFEEVVEPKAIDWVYVQQ